MHLILDKLIAGVTIIRDFSLFSCLASSLCALLAIKVQPQSSRMNELFNSRLCAESKYVIEKNCKHIRN